jgi:hypothetical protein
MSERWDSWSVTRLIEATADGRCLEDVGYTKASNYMRPLVLPFVVMPFAPPGSDTPAR